MDMLERLIFSFVTRDGFVVDLDFYNKIVCVKFSPAGFNATWAFTTVSASNSSIRVVFLHDGRPLIEGAYLVDDRYVSQIQRFL